MKEKKNLAVKEIPFTKCIKFENLTFLYPKTTSSILKNVNLEFPKGKLIGLQGPSGSGKSTLVDLMLGLIKPTEGKISVDGNDINEYLKTGKKRQVMFHKMFF